MRHLKNNQITRGTWYHTSEYLPEEEIEGENNKTSFLIVDRSNNIRVFYRINFYELGYDPSSRKKRKHEHVFWQIPSTPISEIWDNKER